METRAAAASGFLAACLVAAIALAGRGSSGLPDLLLEVPLGGQMKINTADGPMLVHVANQMRCKQGTGSFSSGTTSLAATPCSVAVTGSKDGQYYEGVIKVTNMDKAKASGSGSSGEDKHTGGWIPDDDEEEDEYSRKMKGCKTKPLRLRVTAQGSFLDNVPVFPGDAKTEGMLEQLFHFFGPDKAGLIMQGTLTCRQQWDLEHPDYMIPKPGYPSDVAVKIPHGSSLEAPKDKLAPFKTMIPQVLRQKYGEGKGSRQLRDGLVGAMKSHLFQRDAAEYRKREAASGGRGDSDNDQESRDGPDFATPRGLRTGGRGRRGRHSSMLHELQALSEKVSRISQGQEKMDQTLHSAQGLMRFGQH